MMNTDKTVLTGLQSDRSQGFVYCIWCPSTNTVRIGHTANPEERLKHLQNSCCDRLVPWAYYPGGRIAKEVWCEALDGCGFEKKGSWFDASDGKILKGFMETALNHGGRSWWN